jgi:hypothetical protein
MVFVAEQDRIVDVGRTALGEELNMVDVALSGWFVASRNRASGSIAQHNCFLLRFTKESGLFSHPQHFAVVTLDHYPVAAPTGQLFDCVNRDGFVYSAEPSDSTPGLQIGEGSNGGDFDNRFDPAHLVRRGRHCRVVRACGCR